MYDCIIIGKGPAGITCAIYLKRFNLNVLVIGEDYGALKSDNIVENYYGIRQIKGNDLIDLGIEQAKELGIEIISEKVLDIDEMKVITNNNVYEAKSIFLAMGKVRKKPIKNINEYEGKGVSYCAICDGFFYRDKKIGIVGHEEYMKKELEILKRFTNDITIFTNGLECDIESNKEKIIRIYGKDFVQGIETKEGKYPLDGIFIATGLTGFSFAKKMGLELKNDDIVVNKYMTNIEGIFAGGDIIGGLMQVSKAVYDGMHASMEIKKYLSNKDN